MTTIIDVCKLANVSKATVSRVLSGNRKVKEDTRDVVMRAVEQLNYRPNQLAQTLATKVSNTVGVVTNGLTDSQLGQMLRQLDAMLWGQGRS
ncbi:MAG: LacI family DNA-binding transcriptional regulator, partial [Tolumonas sp.]|nr:LacI family DNA-binding transcriptional regulator [Tolumonas sp.]